MADEETDVPAGTGMGMGGRWSPSRGVAGGGGQPYNPAPPLSFGSKFPGMGIARLQAGSSWLEMYPGLCGYTHPQPTVNLHDASPLLSASVPGCTLLVIKKN